MILKLQNNDPVVEKILNFSFSVFLENGFSKISIESICSSMRISKKTFYNHFSSKEDLIHKIAESFTRSVGLRLEGIVNSEANSVEKLAKILQTAGVVFAKFSDNWLRDIRIHTPDVWEYIDSFRTRMIANNLTRIIRQGISEGLILDCPVIILITALSASIRAVVNPDFLIKNNLTLKDSLNIVYDILVAGILTNKGKLLYNKIKRKHENESF